VNGIVLSTGYPAINLSAKRKLEFNELMINFYDLGDEAAINAFMRSCIDPWYVEIMRDVLLQQQKRRCIHAAP
jgi:hypothetical protein